MLDIGLDWDDTLCPFNDIAIAMANEEYGTNLTLSDIDSWENTGKASIIKKYYSDENLYRKQHISKDAIDFVNKLRKIANVHIITAVAPEFMGIRAKQILESFPDFPKNNIIMGFQKNLIKLDILLDDGPHNILNTSANFPVLMRKPWNHDITGVLAVNNYDEFMQLLRQIQYSLVEQNESIQKPFVMALVGPSGSNKNTLASKLVETHPDVFSIPEAFSTKENAKHHSYISPEKFSNYTFIEKTMYGGYAYGTCSSSYSLILNKGKFPVIPLDMCGAIALKQYFPTKIIYCKRAKENIVADIISDDGYDKKEKTLRILSIEAEKKNQKLCDYIIQTDDVNSAVDEIIKHIDL